MHFPKPGEATASSTKLTRPQLVCAPSVRMTKAAAEHNVSGLTLTKCVLDTDGSLCDCHLVRTLPWMDEAILDALDMTRFTPATFEGHAIRVEFILPIRVGALPPAGAPTAE
jgi:protein TonB